MKQKQAFNPEIFTRASACIAQGALTNSKRPRSFIEGVYPTHLKKASGAYCWDTEGNRYIDFIAGLGSSILGHCNEEVNAAISKQLSLGHTLSLGTELEIECAEKIKHLFPCIESLKFLKTGSCATSAAIKIARAAKSRRMVLSEGYHSWHDSFVSLTPPANGVCLSQDVLPLTKGATFGDDVAAVIVEPIITDVSEDRINWLRHLRKRCTEKGIVLIFDEIITGFRFPQFSASNFYGIQPDLICLGKGLANGLPISVVGGSNKIMNTEKEYFVSSTFAGECLSLAAALKTIDLLQTKFKTDQLWESGQEFCRKFNSIAPEIVKLEGYPTRGVFRGSHENLDLFRQEACRAGILLSTSFFFNFSHISLIDQVISTFTDILIRIKTGSVKLEGLPSLVPFAQKARETA